MISNIIKRKLAKWDLDHTYKNEFMQSLIRIQSRYQNHLLNKGFIIQKVCVKYLKICNKLMNQHNLPVTLNALQFVKGLQLDNYEGKSYGLYSIKIKLNILIIRWLQMSIQMATYDEQYIKFKNKKHQYIERLKLFVKEIEQSFFFDLFYRDYYSNLELILFKILKQQFEFFLDTPDTYRICTTIQGTKKYITKVFEHLKFHILELNDLLSYEQKKVYELMTKKVKLMSELFIIEAVVIFAEDIGTYFSEKEWQKFKSYIDMVNSTPNQELIGTGDFRQIEKYKQMMFLHRSPHKTNTHLSNTNSEANQNNNHNNSSVNYFTSSYQMYKERFYHQRLDQIWQKYDALFQRIPQNVIQKDIFHKAKEIIDSYCEKKLNHIALNHKGNGRDEYGTDRTLKNDKNGSTQSIQLNSTDRSFDENSDAPHHKVKHRKDTKNNKYGLHNKPDHQGQTNNVNFNMEDSCLQSDKTLLIRKKRKNWTENVQKNNERINRLRSHSNDQLIDVMNFVKETNSHFSREKHHMNDRKDEKSARLKEEQANTNKAMSRPHRDNRLSLQNHQDFKNTIEHLRSGNSVTERVNVDQMGSQKNGKEASPSMLGIALKQPRKKSIFGQANLNLNTFESETIVTHKQTDIHQQPQRSKEKLYSLIGYNRQRHNQNHTHGSGSTFRSTFKSNSKDFHNNQNEPKLGSGEGLQRLKEIQKAPFNLLKVEKDKQLQRWRRINSMDMMNSKAGHQFLITCQKNTNLKEFQIEAIANASGPIRQKKCFSLNNKNNVSTHMSQTCYNGSKFNNNSTMNRFAQSTSFNFNSRRNQQDDVFSLPKLNKMNKSKLFLFTQPVQVKNKVFEQNNKKSQKSKQEKNKKNQNNQVVDPAIKKLNRKRTLELISSGY